MIKNKWTHIWRRVQAVCVDHHWGRIGLRRGDAEQRQRGKTSPVKHTTKPQTQHLSDLPQSSTPANTLAPSCPPCSQEKTDVKDLLSSWYYRPTEDKTGSRWIWAEISEDRAVRTWRHFTLQKIQCWSMKPKSLKSSPEGWRLRYFTFSSSFKFNLCLAHSLIHSLSFCLARSLSAREEPDGLLKVMWGEVWHFSHCFYP